MLVALRVKNFILMDELELRLSPGLNVLTGETGAGKSIVVGAIGLVLGGRASAEVVRPGASEAEVEALFDLSARRGHPALAHLEAAELGTDEVVVRRVVQEGGRSRAYLNGRLATAAELAALGPALADVASQHESVALSDPATHLGYLDRFAHLDAAREAIAGQVATLEQLSREAREIRERERSRGEREAFLQFQLQAIDAIAPRADELDELHAERRRLRHAGKLSELVQSATARLEGEEGGAAYLVGRATAELHAASELDESLAPLASRLAACRADLVDLAAECADYAGNVLGDPGRLAEVEDRLYRLEGLLRQYGPTVDDVLATRERLAGELASLASAGTRAAELEAEMSARLAPAAEAARALSRARKAAAERLASAIGAELASLGMGAARVVVGVEPLAGLDKEPAGPALAVDGARLGPSGIDRVEFLISPNKGIDPKPLRRIASGGELSRALLSLKRVLAEHGPACLYVFDEVDSGVGGAVAERIGHAIADVARHHQVLCITHLAPIAAYADAHFVVSKSDSSAVTTSQVARVEGAAREAEVARMLAGAKVGAAALGAAREMIADAKLALAAPATRGGQAPAPAPAPPPGAAAAPVKPAAATKPKRAKDR